MSEINNRILALRKFMQENKLQAFIMPSTDAHLSEYPASHWTSREWISGFTGSAGTVVVTANKAGLWTDSRYFLQAEHQLKGSGIELFKDGLPETPAIDQWLGQELSKGDTVGIDGKVYAAKDALNLAAKLQKKALQLNNQSDPFNSIWTGRPTIPTNPIFELPLSYSGVSASEKIKNICKELDKEGADSLLVASLDTIAWIFNIRGNDVKCNPVAVAYAYVSEKETVLFINPKKLTKETTEYLQSEGVILAEYDKIFDYVASIKNQTICLTGNKVSIALFNKINSSCRVIDMLSPADLMKSKKNETEIAGFRRAMIKDGVALVRFYMWLEKAIPKGEVTETTIAEKLIHFRSQQEHYVGESFDTIAGFKGNGAIVHYHALPESCLTVTNESFLLIDSGAQFFDGTTDITRTWAFGEVTPQMKDDYTRVLKGHINIATCRYPQGTRGSQIDILARKALWDKGLNYLHGTGHGIGHFLNVHEGPQNIRLEENPTTLQLGMVTSNEPGLYRTNQYGIRLENLVLTKEDVTTEFGNFYDFETLTLCHFDTKPIDKNLLTKDELEWFNNYHRMVYERLSPHLTVDEKDWLKEKTKAI